jgi:predicted lactoylglutathione lyase
MARMIFVNLPVLDLRRSTDFFAALGFRFDEHFTDDSAACMLLSDHACVMLLVRTFFAGLTTKDVADAEVSTEAVLALSAASRAEVDALAERALALGARPAVAPDDGGYLYGRSFYDLDGHAWQLLWTDPSAVG